MTDLTTHYLGLKLRSPIVASSSPLTKDIDQLKRMDAAGAGAVVLYSLFEEQIALDELGYARYYETHQGALPEELRHIAAMSEYREGAGAYLAHIYQAKRAVRMPVIASLNGYYNSGWVQYARLIEAAGADALELNIYYLAAKPQVEGAEIEKMYVDLVHSVRSTIKLPLAVKLSPDFSAMANMAHRLVDTGADALVLFNRFYQPDIDIETRTVVPTLDLSHPTELRQRLRWVALLSGNLKADLAITGGVHTASDVVKCLMAGAGVAMMASALLKNGADYIQSVVDDLRRWLAEHDYATSDQIRGLLSQHVSGDSAALERANYLDVLRSNQETADA